MIFYTRDHFVQDWAARCTTYTTNKDKKIYITNTLISILFIVLFIYDFFCSSSPEAPPADQERRIWFYRLIGVFQFRTGNDRLDVVSVGRVDAKFRCVFRRRPRLYTMDDNCWAILTRPEARCNVYRSSCQLDGQLRRWHCFPKHDGESSRLRPAFRHWIICRKLFEWSRDCYEFSSSH